MVEYEAGAHTTIWRMPEAIETWGAAVALVDDAKRDAQEAQLVGRLQLLAERGRLRSPDMMNPEGDQIYAVKTKEGLRAYGWFTRVQSKRAFVISHVILKKKQKLDPADRIRASNCRDAISGTLQATNGRN